MLLTAFFAEIIFVCVADGHQLYERRVRIVVPGEDASFLGPEVHSVHERAGIFHRTQRFERVYLLLQTSELLCDLRPGVQPFVRVDDVVQVVAGRTASSNVAWRERGQDLVSKLRDKREEPAGLDNWASLRGDVEIVGKLFESLAFLLPSLPLLACCGRILGGGCDSSESLCGAPAFAWSDGELFALINRFGLVFWRGSLVRGLFLHGATGRWGHHVDDVAMFVGRRASHEGQVVVRDFVDATVATRRRRRQRNLTTWMHSLTFRLSDSTLFPRRPR